MMMMMTVVKHTQYISRTFNLITISNRFDKENAEQRLALCDFSVCAHFLGLGQWDVTIDLACKQLR